MLGPTPKAFPAPIREKLDKLIRRLSSDSDGECVATVRAIARTLSGSGLDWHDLAVRVAEPSITEMVSDTNAKMQEATNRPAPHRSYSPPPEPQRSPWPTWGNVVGGHRERVRWMQAVKTTKEYPGMKKRREFDELLAKLYQRPHEVVSRKEINLFNIVVRVAWEFGLRLDERSAA